MATALVMGKRLSLTAAQGARSAGWVAAGHSCRTVAQVTGGWLALARVA